jgi:hypothetical protein
MARDSSTVAGSARPIFQNKKSTKDQEPCRAPKEISQIPRNEDVAVVAINRLAGLWAAEPCLVENDHE